ncbi:Rrf2 family transcriptional regulator [Crateriforma spongiae]|uniref:Rrf2 family transcriptional regulator n=1 Tax=Crateriforma spongiae TaxID=2724528 RepID=UPI00144830D5
MKRDSRLSGVLHILLHMAELDEPVTSDDLSKIIDTNPVVVRRLMAGLRERQYVQSAKGHGGGWILACELAEVTLLDIYEAVGSPGLLAMGNRTKAPGCLVEQSVNAALGRTFDEAEQLLLRRLGEVTLASLSADCHQRLEAKGISLKAKRNRHGLQS